MDDHLPGPDGTYAPSLAEEIVASLGTEYATSDGAEVRGVLRVTIDPGSVHRRIQVAHWTSIRAITEDWERTLPNEMKIPAGLYVFLESAELHAAMTRAPHVWADSDPTGNRASASGLLRCFTDPARASGRACFVGPFKALLRQPNCAAPSP